ncbi:redoxin domain-containing protein [bacterium]|nr:redoxin domain-containing protein [bacterium]
MYTRLRRLLPALFVLVLAACGGSVQPVEFNLIAVDAFPQGVGSGFPVAHVLVERDPSVGKTAPDFAFVLENGEGASLSALGKPAVINFWATWCGPCRAEMPELVKLHHEHPELVVLTVNVQEDVATVTPFAEAFDMTMPVPMDVEGNVQRSFAVRGLPTTLFVNADGTIAGRVDGILTPTLLAEQVAKLQ